MSPFYAVPPAAGRDEIDNVSPVVRRAPRSSSALVYLGDKSLVVSESGNAFIMFARSGRTWVALGDPIGDQSEAADLIWRFREMSDQQGALCAFYQVGIENLPFYIETDLGEEAIVMLESFSLDGKSKASLRHSRNRVMKEGWEMKIIPAVDVPPLLPILKSISDEWLGDKRAREKSFSLGSFRESYLCRFPMAVVERNGQICAFANVWPGNGNDELSVDLMRQRNDAPHGVMDYLFVELMLWGKQAGYKRFNLGMAPFSGFEPRELAPLWTKLGTIIYQRGEKYYNFQGLRQYKDKFDPVWEPRFLAAPGGFQLARTMLNIATLVSGGVRGMVSK
jgi:phosphatidylglycerol lysyltransferase